MAGDLLDEALRGGETAAAALGEQIAAGTAQAFPPPKPAAAGRASIALNRGMANVATLIPDNTARVEELKTAVQDLAQAHGKSSQDLAPGPLPDTRPSPRSATRPAGR